jgi:acyl-CoA thioester hydrolase, YbgC/YbaW family
MHETELIVRYAETDQMGIVHHSNYAVWFEAARTEYIKSLGISYSKIEELGLMLPLLGLQCKFIKPARYEDRVIIQTSFKEFNGIRLSFSYSVINKENGDLLATGITEHAWTDKSLVPCILKKKNREIYDLIQKNI